ncbi:MAG: DNA polymerase III subunit delta [Alistipes sp.]|jgi:DNA polymerase-3 subunit delta'|nr:DNA polymerase III subunit delta [Alistipes sp.]
MRFADIIGQQELKRHLARSVDAGRISHAQLFNGIAGAGSLPLAVAYAQYIHCRNRHDGDSCGECPSCRQIAALAHPDLHFVFPVNKQGKKSGEVVLSGEFMPLWREMFERTGGYFSAQQWFDALNLGKTLKGVISTKEAEEIIRRLSFKSFESPYKTMIIWLPETMNDEASNRILKILEEPWENTVFILVTERADLLLKTIISRTQEVSVPRLSADDLMPIVEQAGESDPMKIRNTARLANGDVLEVRRLTGGMDDEVRRENFEHFCSVMRLSYNDKHLELMSWADDVAQLSRERQRAMLVDFSRLLREAFMLHAGAKEASYLWGEEAAFCSKFAPFIGSENIEPIIDQIELAMRQIGQNGNPRIVFTHFALAVSKQIKHL